MTGRHFGTFIRRIQNVPPKTYNYKTANSLCFSHTFGEIKFKKNAVKMHLQRDSKLKFQGCPEDVILQTSFGNVLRMFEGRFSKTLTIGDG